MCYKVVHPLHEHYINGFPLLEKWRKLRREPQRRSEEHTSELQSRLHLLCRLLLEKKKNDVISVLVSYYDHASQLPIISLHLICPDFSSPILSVAAPSQQVVRYYRLFVLATAARIG